MKKFRQFMLTAVIIGSVLTTATAAESFSVLLQKGIFAEETEGNLDAAIKIYQQITAEGATNRSVVAQAQYRLGVCYQKKGNKEQAISILNDLLKQFPAEATLNQKARELLAGLGQTPSSQITMRQLSLNLDSGAAVSPDGRMIAYYAKDEGPVMIHEIPTGKTWTAIEKTPQSILFSPDGRSLAYSLSDAIYTAKVDGTEAKQICPAVKGRSVAVYDWKPDGGQLLVGTWESEKRSTLGTVDLTTGMMREIKNWPAGTGMVSRAKSSSDGRFLAYWRRWSPGAGERRHIIILDQVSNTETKFTDKEIVEFIGWMPESAKLLFTSNRTGTTGLWAITVREGQPAGEPELIKANIYVQAFGLSTFGLTRDGSLFYTESKSFKDIYLATVNFSTGEIMAPPHRVTSRFQGEQSYPVWSKDGQKLMYAVQFGQTRYVAVPMGAGEQKEYPVWETFATWLQNYAWSHDGTYLLVTSSRTGVGLGIHRYELASGAIETLVKTMNDRVPGHWVCHPRIASDGNSFYYTRRDFFASPEDPWDYKDSIIRRNLKSGQEETVYRSPQKLQIWWPFEVSPDGQSLALITSEKVSEKDEGQALKVHSLRNAETRVLVPAIKWQSFISLIWTLDGKRLLYTKGDNDRTGANSDSRAILSIAAEGGQPTEIKFDLPDIRDLALHPDGRQIAFRAGPGSETKIWVLEGLMAKPVAQAATTTNK